MLTLVLGYEADGEEEGRLRFRSPGAGPAGVVDLVASGAQSLQGAGTVHHIAFRARDDQEQLDWQHQIQALGIPVSDVRDRSYFRSIYFREPGGVLFEIATDVPGFAADEAPEELGTHLLLPEWLETHRAEIESELDELTVPAF